ncbi:MAG: twin-arginine translocase TatA/TatE family subunit [Anaerolineales bacterium]|nr:twin-arginine translocase TatA/TatE family subunit [Anaerolineales bacterium]MCB9144037.1 twin-arginine translocase TatA/TatE family subunit [Anaerolineales bacterium]
MFPRLGGLEWVIILVVVILLFGPGRIANVASEIGKSIKSFRDGISGEEEEAEKKSDTDSKN